MVEGNRKTVSSAAGIPGTSVTHGDDPTPLSALRDGDAGSDLSGVPLHDNRMMSPKTANSMTDGQTAAGQAAPPKRVFHRLGATAAVRYSHSTKCSNTLACMSNTPPPPYL